MSLGDLLQQQKNAAKPGIPCKVCTIIGSLSEQDRVDLEAAFLDDSFTRSSIARALQAAGFDIADSTVKRHWHRCVKR